MLRSKQQKNQPTQRHPTESKSASVAHRTEEHGPQGTWRAALPSWRRCGDVSFPAGAVGELEGKGLMVASRGSSQSAFPGSCSTGVGLSGGAGLA